MHKKILMTADTVGGVWTYTIELVRALQPYNIDVTLATMGRPLSDDQRSAVRSLHNLRIFESKYRLEWMSDPWDDVAASIHWLLEIRDRIQPDLVHLNSYAQAAADWDLPVLVVAHSCVFSWWQAVHGQWPPEAWNRYRQEVRRGLHAAAHIVAPSRAMLGCLQEIYGPVDSTSVISNGREVVALSAGPKVPIILSAGRLWDQAKNVSSLVAVADDLPWPVYLAGETGFDMARESNLQNASASNGRVHYLGLLPQDDLCQWMSHASIFALPARYEPFGLSVLEAALAGCALVLGDIPSLRENWDGAAVFVAPNDKDQLSNALRSLSNDRRKLSTMAASAAQRAKQFSVDRMAHDYIEVYNSICGSFSSITH